MKKISIVLAVVAFSVASCKKNYTCTCTVSSSSISISTAAAAKSNKKDADAWCAAFQTDYNSNGGSGWACTVK